MRARFVLHPAFTVGPVVPRLFGSFVEHGGRCVETGIYEPAHPAADESGLRRDVLALIAELGVTMVRYPGGSFVNSHRWEDGVGPAGQRPRRLNKPWRSVETHEFGLSEFMRLARRAGVELMMTLNLGTRGIDEACDLLEYSNHPAGTTLSDLRIAHGDREPFGVTLWCLGNELDGPWEIGHKTAEEYARLAVETARAMRKIDPGIRLVACGSSGTVMPTFPAWEVTVLTELYDDVDYVSCHTYYEEKDGDRDSFLASAVDMDAYIEAVVATCDSVRALRRSAKRLEISFDEWNVWYRERAKEYTAQWTVAPPRIEDIYTVTDAIVFGSMLISLLRHCDRVTAACLAQLVNQIAPIMTVPGGQAWRQTTFYPFAQAARHARGEVLRVDVEGPVISTAQYGDVPAVQATATWERSAEVTVLAVNRDRRRSIPLEIDVRAFGSSDLLEHIVLADPDEQARNTADAPCRVVPVERPGATVHDGILAASLPPMSWNMIRFSAPVPEGA